MQAHEDHAFIPTRSQKARCSCGWEGKSTVDKKKSHKAHVARVS